MEQTALPPLYFTSIPKCGKNIIYSFLFELGYKTVEQEIQAEYYPVNIAYYSDISMRSHYLAKRAKLTQTAIKNGHDHLEQVLVNLKPGHLMHQHLYRTPELDAILGKSQIKTIFIYRDPRDCLLSAMHYAFDQKKPAHIAKKLKGLSQEDALLALLEGDEELVPFTEWFGNYHSWLSAPNIVALKFEDIVGSKGGGNDTAQKAAFSHLLSALAIPVTSEQFEKALKAAFNPAAGTFRKGQIGSWSAEFSPKVNAAFEKRAGHLVEQWGYPQKIEGSHRLPDASVEAIIDSLIQVKSIKTGLNVKVNDLKQQLQDRTRQYEELNIKFAQLSQHLEKQNSDQAMMSIEILQAEIRELRDKEKIALAENVKLRRHYDERTRERDEVAAQLDKIHRQYDELNAERKRLQAQVDKLESLVDEPARQRDELEIQLAKVRRHYDELAHERDELLMQLAKVRRHFDERTQQCNKLAKEMEQLQAHYQQLETGLTGTLIRQKARKLARKESA